MAEKLTWQLNASVAGGPTLSDKVVKTVEAYDKISITIPTSTSTSVTEVELQPATDSTQVTFLALLSSDYDALVTYRVNSDSVSPIDLDGPLFLAGAGAVGILDPAAPPRTMFLTAQADQPEVTITIFIGRDATPEP